MGRWLSRKANKVLSGDCCAQWCLTPRLSRTAGVWKAGELKVGLGQLQGGVRDPARTACELLRGNIDKERPVEGPGGFKREQSLTLPGLCSLQGCAPWNVSDITAQTHSRAHQDNHLGKDLSPARRRYD